MASRGLVAFLGGAATKQSEILDEQRKLKQEEERQRLLLQLREEAEIRSANHADSLARKRTDRNLSGVDGDYFVYRDNDGNETHRRALTPDEIAAREAAKDDRAWERDYKERQLALQRRGQDISAANSRRSAAARSGSGSSEGDSTAQGGDLERFSNLLLETYEEDIKDLASKGVPRAEIRSQARQVASAALSNMEVTGELPSFTSIEDHFNSTLRSMYSDVEERKYNNGRTSRESRPRPSTYTHVNSRGANTVPYPTRD